MGVIATEIAWCLLSSITALSILYGIGKAIEWLAIEVFQE
jgi:hypothetical protein